MRLERVLLVNPPLSLRQVYGRYASGAPRILSRIDKDVTLEDAARGVEMLARSGIRAYGAFMIGTPGETEADGRLTLDAVSCFVYVPYPGTPLRELALTSGTVSADWRDYSAHPEKLPFANHGDSEERVLDFQREFYRRFYLRPSHVLRHLPEYLDPDFVPRAAAMLKDFAQLRPRAHT